MILTLPIATSTARQILVERGRDFIYNDFEEKGSGCFYAPVSEVRKLKDKGVLAPTAINPAAIYEGILVKDIDINSVPENSPKRLTGCFIGEILRRNGLLTEEITVCGNTVASLIAAGRIQVADDYVNTFLSSVQYNQDLRETWGTAYDKAMIRVAEQLAMSLAA